MDGWETNLSESSNVTKQVLLQWHTSECAATPTCQQTGLLIIVCGAKAAIRYPKSLTPQHSEVLKK